MIREMPNEDAGELLKHILSYVNDEEPETKNLLVKMAFGHMKPMLKEDLEKWDKIREIRKKAGSKGGKASVKQNEANAYQNKSIAKQVQAVNDNVNVNDNINVIKKEGKRKIFTPPSQEDVYDYFLEKDLDFHIAKNESEKFVNFYGSKGWLVGKSKMKNWKFAANNWIKRSLEYKQEKDKNVTASTRLLDSVKKDIENGDLSYYTKKFEFKK